MQARKTTTDNPHGKFRHGRDFKAADARAHTKRGTGGRIAMRPYGCAKGKASPR